MFSLKHIVITLLLFVTMFVPFGSVATGQDLQTLLAKARESARGGRIAEAIAVYRRAVLLSPHDAEVRQNLARLLSCRIDTRPEAEKVFAEAVKLAPNDVQMALERASNLVALGEHVNATLEYTRAFKIAPDCEEALYGYVRQITVLGAAPVAIQRLREELAIAPSELSAHLMIGAVLQSEGRFNEALDHFLISQRLAPDNPVGIRGAAKSWLSLGFVRRAEEIFLMNGPRSSSGLILADQARLLIAEEQPELAINLINNELSKVSNEPAALLALADAYHALSQPSKERVVLEQLLATQAKDAPLSDITIQAMERLARVRLEMGENDGARSTCEQLLISVPGNDICRLGLALTGNRLLTQTVSSANTQSTPARQTGLEQRISEAAIFWNQPALALDSLRKASAARTDSLHLLLTLGYVLLKTGDANGAANAFAQVAISDGNRLDAMLGMAEAELLRNRPQQALALYNHALRLCRDNVRALRGQGEIFMLMGKPERAALIFSKLVRLVPSSSIAKTRLQESLTALGRAYKTSASRSRMHSGTDLPNGVERLRNVSTTSIEPVLIDGDKVHISFSDHPELNMEAKLGEDGMLRLPFIDSSIAAKCLTERELGAEIIKAGGAKLTGVNVEVGISEYQLPSLLVAGAVYIPGKFNVRTNVTLLQALMLASGAKPSAGRIIYVVRGGDNCSCQRKEQVSKFEAYERADTETGRVTLNQPLKAGDIVLVTEAQTAFITGAVARQGIVTTKASPTLVDALNSLGGTLPGARRDNIMLHRLIPGSITRSTFKINLDNVEKGQVGKVYLREGDVVEVLSAKGDDSTRTLADLVIDSARPSQRAIGELQLTTGRTTSTGPIEH